MDLGFDLTNLNLVSAGIKAKLHLCQFVERSIVITDLNLMLVEKPIEIIASYLIFVDASIFKEQFVAIHNNCLGVGCSHTSQHTVLYVQYLL